MVAVLAMADLVGPGDEAYGLHLAVAAAGQDDVSLPHRDAEKGLTMLDS